MFDKLLSGLKIRKIRVLDPLRNLTNNALTTTSGSSIFIEFRTFNLHQILNYAFQHSDLFDIPIFKVIN
jgi:hypothetical protein